MIQLNKDSWKVVSLLEICEKAKKIDVRTQIGSFNYVDIGSIDSELNRISGITKYDWSEASSRARQIIRKDDTLFSTVRVNLQRIAFVKNEIPDGIATTGFTVIRAKNGNVNPRFLFYSVLTPTFIDNLVLLQTGTAYPAVTDKTVFSQKIFLPPIEEQQIIADLFQSIDDSIKQAEDQEKNLRALAKRLIDGLISDEPTFGNLLESKELAKVKFADVTDCIEQHERQPLDLGLDRFVGLENIEPENFRISAWGNIEDGTTFTKTFAGGDVLFCKRRSYLKKVAIAEFDGICSSDILVFRAKENKMLAELLPFYAASESFIQYAVNTSAGSLSPRTKWRDLAKFELGIPDLETQAKILEVLQQVQITIEQTIEQKETLKNLKFKLLNEILG